MLAGEDFVRHEWIKPQSVEDRLYQKRILEKARLRNTLVVLPTALGKTMIALLLAAEKTNSGRVFILAPTKPLVQQHRETFVNKSLFSEDQLVAVTGNTPPERRGKLYATGKIIFATPQCVWNDLKSRLLNLNDVSLMVFDEAHRARGNYAYVGIAAHYLRQCATPLVLGLTASPGGSEEKIAEVCRNLGIEAIEHRTDEDDDVKPYIQRIDVEWRRVKLPKAYVQVRDKLREILVERVKSLKALGVLTGKEPAFVTRRDLLDLNEELQRRLNSGEGGFLYQLKVHTTAALSIAHMIELIETQGPETLNAFIAHSLRRMAFEGSRGHQSIIADSAFPAVREMLKNCFSVENPKTAELCKVLKEQFEAKAQSRVIVFTQYRDTVKALTAALAKEPNLKVERFVGQGEREGDPGMNQQQQQGVIQKLRSGEINVLVATSIAEEGLDIPEVDRVMFYEPVPSEIRYIQRRGRTGRRVAGKATIIIAEGTVDEAFYWSSVSRAKKMKRLIGQLNRKLPQLLRQKPAADLTSFIAKEEKLRLKSEAKPQFEKNFKTDLWMPRTVQTKGLSQALKWLSENMPEKTASITELVTLASEETGLEKAAVETALWKLMQQGAAYQPEPGKVRKT